MLRDEGRDEEVKMAWDSHENGCHSGGWGSKFLSVAFAGSDTAGEPEGRRRNDQREGSGSGSCTCVEKLTPVHFGGHAAVSDGG
jgi:hypothetical protein